MHEIDELLASAVELWKTRDGHEPQCLILTIENIPETLELDAGVAKSTLPDSAEPRHIYEAGTSTMELAAANGRPDLVYDWCAFLLNFWSHMPKSKLYTEQAIRRDWFPRMQQALSSIDVEAQQPKHATLTLYSSGTDWFEDDHQHFISTFFEAL